ncbi:four helix bundle protein [Tenacibaculum gallaicum]|uniref:Four helix bundle protein n=1 Tax=Tenacibaculum gallaicum TaxID=561505 RepID=A0A3E0I902_9FLAO|nr:four helix bundle protein [Tenacibaculum gallaicum]REH54625.1 four helix bundle protein [Tenacibaculum gallaicum]
MKKGNIIQVKSYDFAVKIVKLYKHLSQEKKEFVLSKQLLRSGTSIGANIEEARETHYWIRLLKDTGFLSKDTAQSFLNDVEEILKIIGSIQKTIRNS